MKTLQVGIMSRDKFQSCTIEIASGRYKPKKNEPKIWFNSIKSLSREGKLLKIGYGLYAKARINRITGKPMLAAEGGFTAISREALSRLGVNWRW